MRMRATLAAAAIVVAALLVACGESGAGREPSAGTPVTTEPPSSTATIAADQRPGQTPTGQPDLEVDYATYYADHCAVCHGSDRGGVGRAPELTPAALTDDIADYLDETDDRTHRTIWADTNISDAERRALLEYLAGA